MAEKLSSTLNSESDFIDPYEQPLEVDWSSIRTSSSNTSFFETYSNEILFILFYLIIISLVVVLAKRYSYVRTMLVVSVLYLALSFFATELHYTEALLVSIPVWMFWGFRFIKYGVLGVFKDKK